ncbi:glycoside hydrolase family 5 protein [Luedemannella flava]
MSRSPPSSSPSSPRSCPTSLAGRIDDLRRADRRQRRRRGLLPLTIDRGGDPVIADSSGRQVLLRGVNVNQLVDYGQRDPASPTVMPLAEDDYARMAGDWGFNVQRLNLSWSALEPSRGVFDRAYIARVRAAVDQAAKHGIYTVLDMHQDTYSKYVTATPGTTCRSGAEPEFGNDGAPQWATLTNGAKGCGFMGRDLSPNVQQAFTNLYADTDDLGAEFARAWGVLATEFAADTAVAGYDLLNEPGPGNAPGITSGVLLGRLYQQIITSIRAAEAGAYHHLIFFEPSILWSGMGFDATPPVGFSDDPALVFSPHLYNESITMDQGLGVTLTTIEHGYELARRAADAYDVPLWSGEWGWFGDLDKVRGRYDRFLARQNTDLLGSAVWVWKKSCGDPQTGADSPSSGSLNPLACPSRSPMPNPAFLQPALSQAYPRAVPGRLTSLSSSPTGVDLSLTGDGTGSLDVWVPGATAPTVTSTGLTGLTVSQGPDGGWRLTANASGAYSPDGARLGWHREDRGVTGPVRRGADGRRDGHGPARLRRVRQPTRRTRVVRVRLDHRGRPARRPGVGRHRRRQPRRRHVPRRRVRARGRLRVLADRRALRTGPAGRPHLTAQQARAHEDLPFVWWVVDQVMERDRRAWWMRHWVLGTHSIQTPEVFEHREPVLLVGNDEDGVWQLIGATRAGDDGKVGHLSHNIDEDPTLIEILDLPAGHSAYRTHVGGRWTRQPGYPTER